MQISNHNSFRVLFYKIASVYFIWKIHLYFSTGNGQLREPALCQLHQHTFVSHVPQCHRKRVQMSLTSSWWPSSWHRTSIQRQHSVVPTLCLPLHHRNPAPDTQTHLYNIVITQHQRHISPLRLQRHQSAERPILRQTSSLMYPKIQQRQVIMNVLHPGSARPLRWLVASSSPEEVRARAVNSSVNFFSAPHFLIPDEMLWNLTNHELSPLVAVNSLLIAPDESVDFSSRQHRRCPYCKLF